MKPILVLNHQTPNLRTATTTTVAVLMAMVRAMSTKMKMMKLTATSLVQPWRPTLTWQRLHVRIA
jgi:hypothetical protein